MYRYSVYLTINNNLLLFLMVGNVIIIILSMCFDNHPVLISACVGLILDVELWYC